MTAADILEAIDRGCENRRQLARYFGVREDDQGLQRSLDVLEFEGLITSEAGEVFRTHSSAPVPTGEKPRELIGDPR